MPSSGNKGEPNRGAGPLEQGQGHADQDGNRQDDPPKGKAGERLPHLEMLQILGDVTVAHVSPREDTWTVVGRNITSMPAWI